MALRHKAFLLNIDGFKKKLQPFIDELDSGNPKPLYYEALECTRKNNLDQWVFDSIGDKLLDISAYNSSGRFYDVPIETRLDQITNIESSELGYWLLIIFADYSQKISGIGIDYKILEYVLEKIRWKPSDIKLLMKGLPPSLLIKSNSIKQPLPLSHTDPYWFWMRPSHTKGSGGWLSNREINYLINALKSSKSLVDKFDPALFGKKFGFRPIQVPEGQFEYLQSAKTAYENALEMLNMANVSERGLFLVESYT
ncbi:MAG: hypothetical protein DRI56_12920 [Chloroflexota bacterium]|nr:MAG: hypothetical protein B6243_08670 [Anaerolineaceae bacterium 4572_5.2]RLD03181.1 MAG: hypothetical protein DRI56_12920 [Chloroflexota bacterium]